MNMSPWYQISGIGLDTEYSKLCSRISMIMSQSIDRETILSPCIAIRTAIGMSTDPPHYFIEKI